jgi:signal transduction histidine kinase
MTVVEIVCVVIAAISLVTAMGVSLYSRIKTRRIMKSLNAMLNAAIDGSFEERVFDESLLSATEAKLAEYLSASAVSSRNLAAERAKIKELISDISHQTKTPSAGILLSAQLLDEQELSEDGEACVRTLGRQAEKLSFLIQSLVKLSRLETGILAIRAGENPLAPMLEEVFAQYKPRAEGKNIALTLEPTDATALFDTKWTAEAIGNLVDNAIKYTPECGEIRIRAIAFDLFCRVEVIDSGIGIPEDEHPKVFTRFYRSPSVSDAEGVGIGLYLAREILSQQGGYIKLSSEPGKGSTFAAYLPRSR